KEKAIAYGIAFASEQEIDEINILQATFLAMQRAIDQLEGKAKFALIDGNPVKGLHLPSQSIVKGDAKSASIAAASILAKTTRDLWIEAAAEQYPDYAFEVHKGYCTPLHTERIRLHGPCPIHRMTFEPVKSILNPPDLIQDDLFG
ncbi:MAG: ribonuclease HII, partial [Lentisphaeria bacterium]|nr:ribonuclease HII [Lentisphaeria bacterium]